MPEPSTAASETRVCLVPDLDGELTWALDQIEELLLHIVCWTGDEPALPAPPPIGDGTALAVLRRISDAVRPTQGVADSPRLLAPDGRYEHLPLRPVVVSVADIECLVAAAAQFRAASAGTGCGLLGDALETAAGYRPVAGVKDLVGAMARLVALLSIGPVPATRAAWERLADSIGRDVVLTSAEEIAYQHLVDQVVTTWHGGDPICRWLY